MSWPNIRPPEEEELGVDREMCALARAAQLGCVATFEYDFNWTDNNSLLMRASAPEMRLFLRSPMSFAARYIYVETAKYSQGQWLDYGWRRSGAF